MAAIQWSASSGYMSVGVALSYDGNPASGSVRVHAIVYARSDGYGHDYTSSWSWWGDCGSGSESFSFSSGYGQTVTKVISDWYFTVSTSYGQARWVKVGASLGPIWNGGHPSVEGWIQVPARPHEAPAAPTGVSASRASDSQINLSWQIASTAAAPVQSIGIERYSLSTGAWQRVATLSGSARSWSDRGVNANNRYQYRVWGSNSSSGAKASSGGVSTTPAAPTSVSAVKNASGTISVRWHRSAPYAGTGWRVYDNGVKVADVSPISSPDLAWVHQSPSTSTTHTYTVEMIEDALVSARSAASNTVQLLARPNPPQNLAPNGQTFLPGVVRLSWRHSAVDSSEQTKAEVRWRGPGDSAWKTATVTGAQPYLDLTIVEENADSREWQVRTWGAYQPGQAAGASDWSVLASFLIATRPSVSISTPTEGQVLATSVADLSWSYFQAEGSAQALAQVSLQVPEATSVILEEATIQGSATRHTFRTHLLDTKKYTIGIRVRAQNGFWSDYTFAHFTTDFPEPPAPSFTATWNEDMGGVEIAVTNQAAGDGQVEAVENMVERSIDGGQTWETVVEHLPVSGTVVDYEAITMGTTLYRVTATSTLPSSTTTQPVAVRVESDALWISGGLGLAICAPLEWDPVHSMTSDLIDRSVYYFAGRRLGVELSGVHERRRVSVSATLLDESWDLIERLRFLSVKPGPFLYRNPLGERIYGSMSGLDLKRQVGGKWSVAFDLEETQR